MTTVGQKLNRTIWAKLPPCQARPEQGAAFSLVHPFLLVQINVDVLLLVVESCSFLNDTAQLHSKLSLQPIANAISPPTDTPLKTAAVPESKRRDSQKAQGFQHGSTFHLPAAAPCRTLPSKMCAKTTLLAKDSKTTGEARGVRSKSCKISRWEQAQGATPAPIHNPNDGKQKTLAWRARAHWQLDTPLQASGSYHVCRLGKLVSIKRASPTMTVAAKSSKPASTWAGRCNGRTLVSC